MLNIKITLHKFFIKVKNNERLIKNFSFLSLFQLINIITPLLIYPYLIRTVGKENYGEIAFLQAIVFYFVVIVNYGFNLSGTREISKYRYSKHKVNNIVSSIYFIKLLLFVFVLLIAYILSVLFNEKIDMLLLFFIMHRCLFEFMFPLWYFQGVEKIEFITISNFIGRVTILPLFYIFIREASQYIYIPLIFGVGTVLSSSISIYLLIVKESVRIKLPKKSDLYLIFKQANPLFITRLTGVIKDRANIIFIGILLTTKEVALYDLSYRIVNMILTLFYNISAAVFPSFSYDKNYEKYRKVIKISFFCSLIVFLLMLISSSFLINLLGGGEMNEAIPVFRMLSILVIFSTLSSLVGMPLVINNYTKEYFKNTLLTTSIYFIIMIFLIIMNVTELVVFSIVLPITIAFELYNRYIYCKKVGLKRWII